ncbi:hypothetical protein FRB95_014693 [Tulasnella sp. JGI-2019a]|nr:hypothetical protein FRB95_014693 [Tulasnella sp. JGI-2019a]
MPHHWFCPGRSVGHAIPFAIRSFILRPPTIPPILVVYGSITSTRLRISLVLYQQQFSTVNPFDIGHTFRPAPSIITATGRYSNLPTCRSLLFDYSSL